MGKVFWRTVIVAGSMLVSVGCSTTAIGNELVVDLKTDLLPGVEFFAVRTVITETLRADDQPPIELQRTITAEQDFFEGVRLGEFQQLTSSEVTVDVALLDAEGQVLIARPTRVMLKGLRAVTVVISRDCRGVECPLADGDPNFTACLGGSCVDPRCHPEAIEYCDTQALECSADTECISEHACSTARCVERVCFFEADDGLCDALQMCIPESGCIDLPPSCDDGVMNGDETSIDCGGDCDECFSGWAKSFGDATLEDGVGQALAVDSANNVYISGLFKGSVDFGGGPLVGADGVDEVFVASFDSNGTHRWSTLIALSGTNRRAHSLEVDPDDNVIVAVNTELAGTLARLYSYDSGGTLRWSVSLGGTDDVGVRLNDISTDGNGDVYIVGSYSGWLGQLVSTNLSTDLLVGKYDGVTGAELWLNGYGSNATEAGFGIAAAADGTHFITGTFTGSFAFGGPATDGDMFVAEFDSDGFPQWSWSAGSAGSDNGRVIALGTNNQLFVGGDFAQQIDFGTGTHTSTGLEGFLVGVDATTGQVQWSKQFGGTEHDNLRDIHVSDSDKVLLCGDYFSNFSADGTPFTTQGGWDAFVLAYDALSGAFDGWQNYGGTGVDRAHGVALDQNGAMYLTGSYSGTIELAGEVLTSAGANYIFLLKTTPP